MRYTKITCTLAGAIVTLMAVSSSFAITSTPTWLPTETVATGEIWIGNHVGSDRMLAADHYGNFGIAHGDILSIDLHYARKIPGVGWADVVVDGGAGIQGYYPSLAFDRYERPGISHSGVSELRYTAFDGTSWASTAITSGSLITYTSLAFDVYGNPGIAYYESGLDQLKFAYDSDGDGVFERIDTVTDTAADQGSRPKLIFDAQNRPMIAHEDKNDVDLVFSVYDAQIGVWATGLVDDNVGFDNRPSLALNPTTGHPAISYHRAGQRLMYAQWDGYSWGVPEDLGESSVESSLAFDPADGNPAIAFRDGYKLMFKWHDGDAWLPGVILDAANGGHPSLVFNEYGDGWPAISYLGDTYGDNLYFIQDPPAAPEPCTLGLLLIGAAGILRRRKA